MPVRSKTYRVLQLAYEKLLSDYDHLAAQSRLKDLTIQVWENNYRELVEARKAGQAFVEDVEKHRKAKEFQKRNEALMVEMRAMQNIPIGSPIQQFNPSQLMYWYQSQNPWWTVPFKPIQFISWPKIGDSETERRNFLRGMGLVV